MVEYGSPIGLTASQHRFDIRQVIGDLVVQQSDMDIAGLIVALDGTDVVKVVVGRQVGCDISNDRVHFIPPC